jgi:hypothetical protein
MLPKSGLLVAGATTCVVLTGCAGVYFYTDPALTQRTGIPIYAPKPYVLVARTGSKDKPVEVSIVYLNDMERVIYAEPKSGIGSANLTMSLSNGQMTTFGQTTDPKIAELIGSIGGLATAGAGAAKTLADAAVARAQIGTKQSAVSPVILGGVASDVAKQISDGLANGSFGGLTTRELTTVRSAGMSLDRAGSALKDATQIASSSQNVALVKAQADALAAIVPDASKAAKRDQSLALVKTLSDSLKAALAPVDTASDSQAAVLPDFELYEIVQSPKGPSLRLVKP